MSRISLSRRMDRVIDRLLPVGSTERRLRDLPVEARAEYLAWRARCDRAASCYPAGSSGLYRALVEGYNPPPPPPAVATALGMDRYRIPPDATVQDMADLYNRMILEGNDR